MIAANTAMGRAGLPDDIGNCDCRTADIGEQLDYGAAD